MYKEDLSTTPIAPFRTQVIYHKQIPAHLHPHTRYRTARQP